ncbi:hypothetical protein AcW1_002114 [Taiwanofungus camphoratus]|nr:hypothetical protein AcW1_002114 [Antrodia cinnamomea]
MSSLSAVAFIAAILVLIPLPSHWRARNVATLAIIAWLFVVNMIYGVNTAVWAHSVDNVVPVWCDITTKIIIGASSALPACTLCVCKHLELVASSRMVRQTYSDKKRRMIFESIMCFGVPAVLMALHYVVQGHRFDIVEQFGCEPATYYSIPAIFIVWFVPLLFSTITMVYAALAFFHFFRKRMDFAAHLANANSSLTTHRYLRLMAMSITEMAWGTSLTAFTLYVNVAPGLRPWISWANVHSNFSRVDLYATLVLPPHYRHQLLLLWWAMPASAIIFFLFFGFGSETVQDYRRAIDWFRRKVLRQSTKKRTELPDSLRFMTRRSPPSKSVLSTLATVNSSVTSKDDHTLPMYSPPVDEKALPATPSKPDWGSRSTLTFSESFPHGIPSPSTTAASTAALVAEPGYTISISDPYPASRPPTPPAAPEVSIPAPAYHRPFSPPSICPVDLTSKHVEDSVVVMVNTEVAHMV